MLRRGSTVFSRLHWLLAVSVLGIAVWYFTPVAAAQEAISSPDTPDANPVIRITWVLTTRPPIAYGCVAQLPAIRHGTKTIPCTSAGTTRIRSMQPIFPGSTPAGVGPA